MRRNDLIISIMLTILICIMVCGCSQEKSPPSGIRLSLEIAEPYYDNSVFEFAYCWSFDNPEIEFREGLMVFVHVWNIDQDKMILQDDHKFEITSEDWSRKQEIRYIHDIHIPGFIYNTDENLYSQERIRINAGLYDPSDKDFHIQLFSRIYVFEPLPYYYPRVFYSDGWYDEEKTGSGISQSWTWTAKEAVLFIDNTGLDMELHLTGEVMKSILPEQSISVYLNDMLLDNFIPEDSRFYRIIKISSELLNDELSFKLVIKTDKTFIASESGINPNDHRVLGFKVYFIYFKAAGPAGE